MPIKSKTFGNGKNSIIYTRGIVAGRPSNLSFFEKMIDPDKYTLYQLYDEDDKSYITDKDYFASMSYNITKYIEENGLNENPITIFENSMGLIPMLKYAKNNEETIKKFICMSHFIGTDKTCDNIFTPKEEFKKEFDLFLERLDLDKQNYCSKQIVDALDRKTLEGIEGYKTFMFWHMVLIQNKATPEILSINDFAPQDKQEVRRFIEFMKKDFYYNKNDFNISDKLAKKMTFIYGSEDSLTSKEITDSHLPEGCERIEKQGPHNTHFNEEIAVIFKTLNQKQR